RDIAGLLALSAARQGSALGLLAFSDQKELYLPPAKGPRPTYALIQRLFALAPASGRTAVGAGIRQALGLLKRRSLVVLVSDFIDGSYERELTMLAQRHDLIVVQVLAPRERHFPALGIVPLRDAETGEVRWVNTSSLNFRARVESAADRQEAELMNLCRRTRTGFLALSTEGDFVPQLVNLFRHRQQSGRRG
ncbi:MAG: hypothetical protein JWR44_3516, partial [Hymenobacter sp.]|nr:hypothetical protein [Hymenobacter sp.]